MDVLEFMIERDIKYFLVLKIIMLFITELGI